MKAIDNMTFSIPDTEPVPTFESFSYQKGNISVRCKTERHAIWLKKNFELWEGANLKVID